MGPTGDNVSGIDLKIKKRRERGRRAQSAFRKRQAQAKVDLGVENGRLRQALEAIINEAVKDDQLALLVKIQEAADILQGSFQQQESATSHEEVLSSASYDQVSTASSSRQEIVDADATSLSGPSTNAELSQLHSRPPKKIMQTLTPSNVDLALSRDQMLCRSPWERPASDDWLTTTMPFLGSGAFTLAGRIFWRLISAWEARTNSHIDEQLRVQSAGPRFVKLQSARRSTLSHHFDYSSKVFDTSEWVQAINSRLNYDVENGMLKIREPSTRIQAAERWLSTTQIEERIRYIVGNEVYAVLTRPMLDRWETSRDIQFGRARGPESMLDFTTSDDPCDTLLDWVVENYTCFGDGPRWSQNQFDEGLKAWISKLTGHV